MSAVLNIKQPSARPALRLVQNPRSVNLFKTRSKMNFAATLVIGCLTIALLNLGLSMANGTSVYEVSSLKSQKAQLDLSSQILSQQVDSLSSNQNLASAAQAMGMVANANPVFLDLSNQKVYGSPLAASQSTALRVSGNLVDNAEWTTKTQAGAIKKALAAEQAKATQSVVANVATAPTQSVSKTKSSSSNAAGSNADAGYVGGAKSLPSQVGLANSGIPTAPTH